MVSQCIHIEYKSKNSWCNSVFTLNTKVKTHGITKLKLMVSQCIHIEISYPVPKDCVSQSIKVKLGTE
ncbi:hypothetical protein OUZ56_021560 [Daphnia magna]|uniref:Uncharacterized protein n=1 Tax=Daphnia magna TaxID=35525 RepID=A0ABR0AU12_9CRUS|nr:hypothetical protein OUZ56_021560 [Daphnia magna]